MSNDTLTPSNRDVLALLLELQTGKLSPIPLHDCRGFYFTGGAGVGRTTADLLDDVDGGRTPSMTFARVPLPVVEALASPETDVPTALRALVLGGFVAEYSESSQIELLHHFATASGTKVSCELIPSGTALKFAVYVDEDPKPRRISREILGSSDGRKFEWTCYSLTPAGYAAVTPDSSARQSAASGGPVASTSRVCYTKPKPLKHWARVFGTSEKTIGDWLRNSQLAGRKQGNSWALARHELPGDAQEA